ncbi:MAG TPA: hypothetical protein VMS74_08935 [Acidimicrobiia bacterium]|nr:hypothetical protein [Acidimicrobiia bacterium]
MGKRFTVLAVIVVVLAACGGDDGAGDTTTTSGPPETTAAPAPGIGLASTSLGEVLVGPEGMTVYGFTVDDPRVSNCYDECAQVWPPLDGDTAIGDGLDASLFSVTQRDDGTTQLVVGEWPLYYFAGDSAPGDVNGQDVEGVWFVVDADGELVGADDTESEEETTTTTAAAAADADITVGESELGPMLVDADGFTLYGFTPDSPTESTCTGPCADNWPPVSGDAVIGADLDESLMSSITRDDGTTQLVYGDWPLYRFAGDGAPGDINGQGVNDVWFVIGPDATLYR